MTFCSKIIFTTVHFSFLKEKYQF